MSASDSVMLASHPKDRPRRRSTSTPAKTSVARAPRVPDNGQDAVLVVAFRVNVVPRVNPGPSPPDRDGAAGVGSPKPIPPTGGQHERLRGRLGAVRRTSHGRARLLLRPR